MDEYIDNTETQTYGPKLKDNLTAKFASSADPVRKFVAHLAGLLAEANEAMAKAMSRSRGATSDLSSAALAKSPAAEAARKLLSGFHKHLTSKRDLGEWAGRVKLFVPNGLSGVGRTASDLVTALGTALDGLEKDKTVPDGEKLANRLADSKKKLADEDKKTGGAMREAQSGLSEQSAEKKAWIRRYRGIALIAEGLLMIEDRASELATVVPHLSIPGGKKKKTEGTP